ncbi:MAG: choice-of-anchor J domain-containing protein [Bacteroidales bacterium]|nr:choice-of-anchor J domain-containing protein [Bacteroidales bacterium]
MLKQLLLSAAVTALGPTAVSAADTDLFFTDFATQSELYDNFKIIDVNDDGNTWRWYGGDIFVHSNDGGRISTDDWLISPALELEAGKTYALSFYMWTENKYAESVEIFFGTAPTIEAMTETLLPKTEFLIKKADRELTVLNITPAKSGTYYVGWHGCSAPNRHNLHLDDIRVAAGEKVSAPMAMADFKAVADRTGLSKAVLEGTMPVKAFDGSALTGKLDVELTRDGKALTTVKGLAPGARLSFTDDGLATGEHEWTAIVIGRDGRSNASTSHDYVGPSAPLRPAEVSMVETSTTGRVNISWTPVLYDEKGKQLADGMITYTVVEDEHVMAEGLTKTNFTSQIRRATDPQEFISVGVYAMTAAGESDLTESALVPVGRAYALPWVESFANAENENSVWAIQNLRGSGYGQWKGVMDSAGIPSQDGDNGLVAAFTPYEGDCTRLISGKIDLKGADAPVLQAYYYNIEGGTNTVELQVREFGKADFETVARHTNDGSESWTRMIAPLENYIGKTVQFALQTTMGNQYYSVFDNLRLFNLKGVDLEASAIAAPSVGRVGDNIKITVDVVNNGSDDVNGFTVVLYRDGEQVAVSAPANIDLLGSACIEFTDCISTLHSETSTYYATIECAGDADNTNNTTRNAEVRVDLPLYPSPADLEATKSGADVTLVWSRPDVSSAPVAAHTEDFEDYRSGTISDFGDWTLIDGDLSETYGIEDVEFEHMLQPMAYMIFDYTWQGTESYPEGFRPHSGNKYAVCMAAYYDTNDDWLISPELSGEAHRVTFYARSFMSSYRESFEFMVSSTGTDPDDFRRVGYDSGVPARWTAYGFDVPAGTKYFAIHCNSDDQFMFMIDDISFTPAGMETTILEHKGYNVYRNGVKVNASAVSGETFTDRAVPDGDHRYLVTALYDRGESVPSNDAYINMSGIADITLDGVTVSSADGCIVIDGAKGMPVAVVTPAGQAVLTDGCVDADRLAIPVTDGIYVVNVGGKACKVVVK